MEGLRYIPKRELFRCGVEMDGARKFFVWDGVPENLPVEELGLLDMEAAFDVASKMEHLVYAPQNSDIPARALLIAPEPDVLSQIIFVRVSPAPVNYRTKILCNTPGNYQIVLCSHTTGSGRFLTKETVEIEVTQGARADIVIMQNENALSSHKADFRLRTGLDSSLKMNIITLHAGNVSNKVHCLLSGRGAECSLNGLYLADGEQIIETDVTLVHGAEECISRQLFKGILAGNSRSRFTGEVVVTPAGQKTEAYQSNNNLLTSDTARASSDPHLVIYADDVKCSHGSTSGSIGDEELFYMRSRGISQQEARLLQQQAFAGAVLEKVSNPELRERLTALVERRLRGK